MPSFLLDFSKKKKFSLGLNKVKIHNGLLFERPGRHASQSASHHKVSHMERYPIEGTGFMATGPLAFSEPESVIAHHSWSLPKPKFIACVIAHACGK